MRREIVPWDHSFRMLSGDRSLRRAYGRQTLACIGALALLASQANARQPATSWAISGATLIDGTGARPLADSVIVGREDRIICVGSATDCLVPADASVTDATGKWVVPGLIDTHVHLGWTSAKAHQIQQTRLAFGITTTRDAGTPEGLEEALRRREGTNLPASPEPRLVVAAIVSDDIKREYGASDLADLVRVLTARGVDAIKIKEEFSPEELRAIVAAAHSAGRPVFGHTWGQLGSHLMPALEAGVDGISHVATFSAYAERRDAGRPPPPADFGIWLWAQEQWNYADQGRLQAAVDAVVEHHAWIEPMLVTEKHFTFAYPLPERFAFLGKIRSLEQLLRASLPIGFSGWPARRQWRRRQAVAYSHMCDFVRRFHTAGGIVVTGTDNGQPGIDLADEVGLLAECGLTPMEALRAATAHAAAALKRDDRGTIERNKLADLVILEADPLNDPGNLTRIWRVVKGGHSHDPAALLAPTVSAYRREWRRTWLLRAFGLTLLVAAVAVTGRILVRRYRRR